MNLQRPDLKPKPSCSKSRSVWQGCVLNVTSAYDVFSWPLLHYYFSMLPSQDQLLAKWPFWNHTGNLGCFSWKVTIIAMCMGNWNRSTDCSWRRMEMSLSSTESTGWSCLLWMYQTNSTDSTRHQSSKLGLWSQVFKAKPLVRNFTDLQCVLIINCLPQTVQVAICRLVSLPDIGWGGGKTGLFEVMLSWQPKWADLQWLSTIGSLLLTPNSFPLNV